jgi:integrase
MAVVRVSRPMLRTGTHNLWFRRRIPQDMLRHPVLKAGTLALAIPVGGMVVNKVLSAKAIDVSLSLQTPHKAEGTKRQAEVVAYLENVWAALRRERPIILSNREITALAGKLYRAWANESAAQPRGLIHRPDGSGQHRDSRGNTWDPWRMTAEEEEAGFAAGLARFVATMEEDLERLLGPVADRLLLSVGIYKLDAHSRAALLSASLRALQEAFASRQRQAAGDYAEDPNAGRYPPWVAPAEIALPPASPSSALRLPALLELWWAEASALHLKPATYNNYASVIRSLSRFLKHDDARLVTAADIVGFKTWRLATTSPRTKRIITPANVKAELAGLRTVFTFALANNLLTSNPVLGVTMPKIGSVHRARGKGLTDEEAVVLLRQASEGAKRAPNEMACTAAARRWIPWLLAYTGARVGELGQLRKQDVRRVGPHWVLTITPEAGTVKTNKHRDVVIHPHLVEQGFIEFIEAAPKDHLFLKVRPGESPLGPLKGLKSRLGDVARLAVSDPNVAPHHGWRHRFKTMGREAGIGEHILGMIQGHTHKTVGEGYGEVTITTMAAAIAKFPRYDVTAATGG